jgi:hypothetical protein
LECLKTHPMTDVWKKRMTSRQLTSERQGKFTSLLIASRKEE